MKIIFITGGLTPYRVAFCDSINEFLKSENLGELKMLLLSREGFNSNYDNKKLERSYTEYVDGKTIVLKDNTTRFMINPGIVDKILYEKPDFVILGGSWAHPTTWLLLNGKKRICVPIYFWAESHFHNGLKRKKKSAWKEIIKKMVYNKFDGFFVPGLYATEAIVSTNCKNSNKCLRLPNLIDNKLYIKANSIREQKEKLRFERNIPISNKVLFTPSRLVDLKGLVEFVNNGKTRLNKGFTWIIAGIGPLKEKIEQIVFSLGLDIRLVGFIDQDRIIEYLALSDWFLLPSLSDPNPLSVIEALWAGLPVALSMYVGNNPETLIDGENGFIFDTLSVKSVCGVLEKIKDADEYWLHTASQKSLEIAYKSFDMEKETRQLVIEVERIVSKNE